MKFLSLLKYLSYLSPILVKKYSCVFEAKYFIHSLRLNTLLPYSDVNEENRDRKIGRPLSGDYLYMAQYDNLLFLKYKHDNKGGRHKTLLWIRNRTPLIFYKIIYGSFGSLFQFLACYFLIFSNLFSFNIIILILALIFLILNAIDFRSEIKDHDTLISKVIDYCNSEQKKRTN